MFTITKQFTFSASHLLPNVPAGHPCGRLHGHNYVVEIELQAEQIDSRGFVVDYGELAVFGTMIDHELDHEHLNTMFANPTAEYIAEYLYRWAANRWPQTSAVRVSETPKTWAEYRPHKD